MWQCPQVDNEFKENWKKYPTLNYLRSWNLCPKTIFNQLSLSITSNDKFEDLNLIFYNRMFNKTTKVIMKIIITWTTLGLWPKKIWFWYTRAPFWSTLQCLHPYMQENCFLQVLATFYELQNTLKHCSPLRLAPICSSIIT